MKAIKNNKVYTLTTAQEKALYLADGYDITDDKGNVIEYCKGKTIDYNKFKVLESENETLKSELETLKAENEDLKISAMTVDQLKAYALENNIAIADATTKDVILERIRASKAE